jgi:triacylglycerol esterase/lipase EstA (alpha/beta hydrolase family)
MTARTHPIVLAHGIARFDVLVDMLLDVDNDDELDHKHYFKGIRTHLRSNGFDVWHTQVDWAGSVTKRSSDLKRAVEALLQTTGAEKIHIIAHSMGGLDSRHMLFDNRNNGFHRKVASVTTISTPHRGSPVADFILNPLGFLAGRTEESLEAVATPEEQLAHLRGTEEFQAFASLFGIDPDRFGTAPDEESLESTGLFEGVAGVRDLTLEATASFNAESLPWERTSGVSFNAYAGAQPLAQTFPPLQLVWGLIQEKEGANDGLVSVESAKWTNEHLRARIDADHLNELGWWPEIFDPRERDRKERDSKAFYLGLAHDLARQFPLS